MNHQRWHFIEKIQVELAALVGLIVMYFVAWPIVAPWDVDGAVLFLPIEAGARLWVFAAVVWFLAAVAAVMTISARPEGALLAALVAAGGACLHSQPMRRLLMRFEGSAESLSGLFRSLAGEVLYMIVILLGAIVVVHVVRGLIYLVAPGWVRFGGAAEVGGASEEGQKAPLGLLEMLFGFGGAAILRRLVGKTSELYPSRATPKQILGNAAAAFALTLLFGMAMLGLTFYSTDRGQILFALAASFFVAAAGASYFFPAGTSAPCWLAPIVLAAGIYLRAGGVQEGGALAWVSVDTWAHALPVDWLSAGCGGAVGGYWLSCRLHAMHRIAKPTGQTGERA